MQGLLRGHGLHSVCEEARCPNRTDCFGQRRVTFLLLGDLCTRACPFCGIATGRPAPPDAEEPGRVAAAAAALGLRHVVLTSVNRDDLEDGGAGQFAITIEAIRARSPGTGVEVLTPDFRGSGPAIESVAEAGPDVYNHNVETVPRLYRRVRPGARYSRSLALLERVKRGFPRILTKSGLMLGLGEREEEVRGVLRDLRTAGIDAVTLGQYLRPSLRHVPVEEYVPPARFAALEAAARGLGFRSVASGPFVRSSFHAEETWDTLRASGGSDAAL